MAKDRSDKSKYHSRYSEGYVSAAQYVTELICEKKATSEKKELPIFFWKLNEWAKYFRNQIASANRLLKIYSESSVIKALMLPSMKNTYSLRAPWLEKEIIKLHKIELATIKEPTEFTEVDINKAPEPKPNPLQHLLDMDNE